MSALHTSSPSLFIAGRHAVVLSEKAAFDAKRRFELQIDGLLRGEVSLTEYSQPGVAVGPLAAAIWGGMMVYIAPFAGGRIDRFAQQDEIHAAYPIDDSWCLVGEVSVVLFDPVGGHERSRYDHDEIILRHRWADNRLLLEDLQGRQFALAMGGDGQISRSAQQP